ncbi:MAG TPA: hypothetical protein VK524_24000 [Polyangiaceae bacterium]|nr:hypothetical protein [Polyangiaceae bacterium]
MKPSLSALLVVGSGLLALHCGPTPPAGTGGAGGTAGTGGAGGTCNRPAGTTDPGTAQWTPVPAANKACECGLDPALLEQADRTINTNYAIVRYGKLCHEFNPTGSDARSEVWSTTKTFGSLVTGVAAYQTRNIPRTGPKTGGISDGDRADHWLDSSSITFNNDARLAHVLAMVGHNANLGYGQKVWAYDTVGTVQINRLSDVINAAVAQDPARLGANIEAFTQKFVFSALGMRDSSWSNGASTKVFAYTWNSTVRDMARVGLLMLHRGMWSGTRILDADWVYRMTHPAFEDSATGYGYLTWLNTRAPKTGMGAMNDPCAPPALWKSYPHEYSGAPDCNLAAPATCQQQYDAGVWMGVGLGGQHIVGHPGLDMVIVAKNSGGPPVLWDAIRPALLAHDSQYQNNPTGFCQAYGSGSYAPDFSRLP